MAPTEKKRVAADVTAWFGNVSSSVLVIYSNKILMSSARGYGFRFATTLCALHYLTCSLGTFALRCSGQIKRSKISWRDLIIFTVAANLSIVSLNLSLMLNPVGLYQMAKLCIIPCTCLIEAFWLQRSFPAPVIASVLTVLLGVAIVTVTDLTVTSNLAGVIMAALSVISSTLQQIFCRTMQQRNNLDFLEFLSHTAPAQGWSLIFFGPFLDYAIGGSWLFSYHMSFPASMALLVSCSVAVAVNVSQFACLGRFQAVSFQVLGHTKTVLVLLGGWAFLGDSITQAQLCGMLIAICGMISYGFFTSKKKEEKRAVEEVDEEKGDRLPQYRREDGRLVVNVGTSQRRATVAKANGS